MAGAAVGAVPAAASAAGTAAALSGQLIPDVKERRASAQEADDKKDRDYDDVSEDWRHTPTCLSFDQAFAASTEETVFACSSGT